MTGKPVSLLVRQCRARRCFRVGQLCVALFLFWSSAALSSAIKAVTLGPISTIRGDLVSVAVDPVDQASIIEWWVGDALVCQKARCEIDTSRFTPGEYSYYVVVRNSAGIEIAEVRVSAELAPPMYKPKIITPDRVGPNKKASFIANGEWILIPRFGLVGASRKSTSTKTVVTDFVEKPAKGRKYRVGARGSAILRRVGHLEEWILDENSLFTIRDEGVSLQSGSGVWRKLKQGDQAVSRSKIFGITVEALDDQVIVARPTGNGTSDVRAEIRNLQGPDAKAVCARGREVLIPSKSRLQLGKGVGCKVERPAARDVAAVLLSSTFPIWTNKREVVIADRWRAENERLKLIGPLDKSMDIHVNQAFDGGGCSDVLDLTGASSTIEGDLLMKRARCQFVFGLLDDALKNFKSLEAAGENPPLTALMLARTYHLINDVPKALEWYKIAYTRGYLDRSELSREAVDVARDAGLTRSQLAWLDAVALNEEHSEKLPEAQEAAGSFRKNRPNGAELDVGVFMDSQAVPINSKETDSMPSQMRASRNVVGALQAAWWTTKPLTQRNRLAALGQHSVRWPTGEKQPPFTISKHDLKISFFSEAGYSDKGQPRGRWLFEPSAVIGTATLGPSRARDRYGWDFNVSYLGKREYSFAIMSDKYLDPSPDGLKDVDIDLYRYVGPGDFSHLDFGFLAKILEPGPTFSWSLALYYLSVDYRTLSFSSLDHDLLRIEFDSQVTLSRAVMAQVRPRYERLNYIKSATNASEASVEALVSWRFMPLWSGRASMAYQARVIEGDPIGSWNRLIYGLSIVTDL